MAGPGSIIQSDFRGGGHGNFEVVVPLAAPGGMLELAHFWHNNSDINLQWDRGLTVAADVTGPGVLIQSDFMAGAHGNFELVVPEKHSLTHYWRDNSDVNLPWQRGQVVTDAANDWGCMIQSGFGWAPTATSRCWSRNAVSPS